MTLYYALCIYIKHEHRVQVIRYIDNYKFLIIKIQLNMENKNTLVINSIRDRLK